MTKYNPTLVSGIENRPQTLSSTRYDTVAVSGTQDRTRFDVVSADEDVDLLELEQGTKEVTKKDFTVEYDEVTKTRDNFITLNKLCDVEYEEEVQETILVDVAATCPTTVNQPLAETVYVDQVAVTAQKVGYAHVGTVGAVGGVGLGRVGVVGGVGLGALSSSPFFTSSGDGVSGSDCGSWCSSPSDSDHGAALVGGLGGLGGLRGYYGATGLTGLNAGVLGARSLVAPVVAKRAVAVTVPKTVLVDNYVTVDVACVKQEEQVVTKTVTKTRKEPCTETINYQTTVTQDIPRTNVFDVTDSVDVTRQGSRTDTIERDVAALRVGQDSKNSIDTVRTDSTRVRDNFVAVQSVGQQAFEDLTFTPSEVEVSRQNLRYKDVEKTVSYDASIEGTEVKIQEVPTQKRVLQLQTDLGPIGEDPVVPGRGSNGNILVAADASFVATGGLARPIVASNGIVGDNVIVQGAPAGALGGDVFLNGGLGRDGAVAAGTGVGGSSVGVGLGTRIADGTVVQNGAVTVGAPLADVDGVVTGGLVGGLRRFGRGRFGGLAGGLGSRLGGVGGVYGRGYAAAHGW